MSRSWRGGSTRAWRRLRASVLARYGYACQLRLPGTWVTRDGVLRRCAGRADTVHHTLGRAVTGDDPRFLVAACTACNLKIGEPSKVVDPKPQPRTRW